MKINLSPQTKRAVKQPLFYFGKAIADFVDKFSRGQRQLILYLTDLSIFVISILSAFCLYSDKLFFPELAKNYLTTIYLILPVKFLVFYWMGMYRGILRYTQSTFIQTTFKSVVLAQIVFMASALFLGLRPLPRTVQVLDVFLTLSGVILSRSTARWFLYKFNPTLKLANFSQSNRKFEQPVIVYGAGRAGFELFQALRNGHTYRIKAFIDDDKKLWNYTIDGVKVFDPQYLNTLLVRYGINTVLLAIPSAPNQRRQEIVQELISKGLEVKTIPTISEIISGQFSITQVRNVEITDLLGREEVSADPSLLSININNKSVLVTGAGGSIGSELCRQIAAQHPKKLVLYELNEFALYSIDMDLSEAFPEIERVACLGSVTEGSHFREVLLAHGIQTIYHAAAYKHVPLVEHNAAQGVLNNVYGTLICTRMARECGVEKFVLISTDKAVRPTNIMGTTKRLAELILQAQADLPDTKTEFVMVRFGNVLNSSGSVIPRFRKQIEQRKPITITHPDITRYFMSIPEAARLVIQAGALGKGGEVFLLDMGEPVKIYDMAVKMIELSGLMPGKDVDIVVTGLRPGEKLYEELLIETHKSRATKHRKIFMAQELFLPWSELEPQLDRLFLAARSNDHDRLVEILKFLVPEYQKPTVEAKTVNTVKKTLPSQMP